MGFEPATYGFQIRRSNHSATLPPQINLYYYILNINNNIDNNNNIIIIINYQWKAISWENRQT